MENHVVELVQPRHTLIGENSILEIPQFLHRLEGTVTALVVTDQGLVKIGTVKKVTDVLDRAGIRYWTYDGVQPNPSVGVVNKAMEQYTRQGCNCIIAIGGGSPIDVAKAVSILAANGGRIEDYCGVRKSARPGVPIVAVNTTAGTGSEVTCAYVITDEVKNVKMVMMDPNCLAYLAINDPTLMVGMPPSLTAATGMDALTHAVEAYTCREATPYTDALAIEAIRLVGRSLRRAVADGCDMQARTDMCWAEYMAGLAFSNAGLVIDVIGLGNGLLLHILQHFPVILIVGNEQDGDENDEDHTGYPQIGIQHLFEKSAVLKLLSELLQNVFQLVCLHDFSPPINR